MKRLSFIVLFSLLVTACAGTGAPRDTADEGVEPAPPYQNPAVIALLEEAERQRTAGNLSLAASAVERALRISPRDPVLRIRLGWLRLEQGDPFQAKELARMGVVYAGERDVVEADAWELVAAAERAIGNQVEAALAAQEAERLRGHR